MSRRMVYLAIGVLAAVFIAGALWMWAGGRDGGEPAELGGVEAGSAGESGEPAGESGSDEPSSAVPGPEDAVPMETVDELFTSLDEMGLKPSMNETFTVQYDGSFERIVIVGAFEDEGTQTVVFRLTADGAWEIVEE